MLPRLLALMLPVSQLARKNWLVTALLISVCAILFLPGIGASLVSRQQELRVLLTARDMAEGGDWIVPHFMGAERLRKPPLMYWLVAGAFKIAGTTENAAAARAVSAAAATTLVLATFFMGRRFIGRRAALTGALVLATSVGFLRHARLAETDIAQTMFCSVAAFSLFAALTRPNRSLAPWIFAGISSGLGVIVKSPASLAMPAAATATFAIIFAWQSRSAGARRLAINWPGLIAAVLVCAAIAAPWYIAVALKTASTNAQASDEINRLLAESSHKGPLPYYVWTLPARMGIWALALPVAVFTAAKKLRHHRGPLFLLCWLGSTFAILSALSSKQAHYALLLMPPAALLTGWLLARPRLPFTGKTRRGNLQSLEQNASRIGFHQEFAHAYLFSICLIALFIASALVICWWREFLIAWPPAIGIAGFALVATALAALAGLLFRRSVVAPLLALVATLAFATGFHALRIERIVEGDAIIGELVADNRDAISDAPRFFVHGPHSAMAVWHAHRPATPAGKSLRDAWLTMREGDVLFCSARKKPLDISAIDAKPDATRTQLDASACIFRKAGEVKK